jgi:hypothetical protein
MLDEKFMMQGFKLFPADTFNRAFQFFLTGFSSVIFLPGFLLFIFNRNFSVSNKITIL